MKVITKIITWWGLLTPLCALGGVYLGEAVFGNFNGGYELGIFVAGVVNFAIGYGVNRRAEKAEAEGAGRKLRAILLFIPMQWWSVLFFAFAMMKLTSLGMGI